ncbi:MAG TPA: FAD-dependent oxidoreductase [Chloroflexota bacterium]
MPQPLPPIAWRGLRWCGVGCALALIVVGFIDPSLAVTLFWSVFVPIMPLVFLLAPGVWRNVCPMASLNQIPRTLKFTRGQTIPPRIQQLTPLISIALFLLIVPGRKLRFDQNGIALAFFLLAVLGLAFAGGVFFKGKSGWCSQFCPMLQIERFYGQSPLLVLPNSHCRPCVGCNKNCYDFNPTAGFLADLHDENPRLAANRKLIAGAIPWVIVAFFTQPYLGHLSLLPALTIYGRILIAAAAGAGFFLLLETITPLSAQQLVLGHVVAAINLFYWYGAPLALKQLGLDTMVLPHAIQAGILVVSLVWLKRALPTEAAYLRQVEGAPVRVAESVLKVHGQQRQSQIPVIFHSGPTVLAKGGETLLDLAEGNGVALESGCRMGVCGADPVRLLAGAENLSPAGGPERATLERLGLGAGCRMACCARVQGPVTVSRDLTQAAGESPTGAAPLPTEPSAPAFIVSPEVRRVVVIGNGVAGVTAAVELKKLHPDLSLTLLGEESYDFYNRMAVDKLVREETAIQKLYLMPRDWAETRRLEHFPAIPAARIDREAHQVIAEDGQVFPYDRLILATGARAVVPRLEGSDLRGVFALRTIDDAIRIQQHIRQRRCGAALVIGGGPLGLEAAHSMTHLGVRVTVIDRGPWPMNRQLDEGAGGLLRQMMKDLGVVILPQSQVKRLQGNDWLEQAELADGRIIKIGLCLAAMGIEPSVDLARAAGLNLNRGVVTDDRMATSDPDIFAIGDVAECNGRVMGLWPAGVAQAQVAVVNALGGDHRYQAANPPMKLKVAGIDLLSVGDIAIPEADGREVRAEAGDTRAYRKLILKGSTVQGGILIGYADLADSVTAAVEARIDVAGVMPSLLAGDWSVLAAVPV